MISRQIGNQRNISPMLHSQADVLIHKLSKKDREISELKSLVTQLDLTRERLSSELLNQKLYNTKKGKQLRQEMFERDELSKKFHSELLRSEKMAKMNEMLLSEKNTLLLGLSEKDTRIRNMTQNQHGLVESNRQLEDGILSLRKTFENQITQKGQSIAFLEDENQKLQNEVADLSREVTALEQNVLSLRDENEHLQHETKNDKETNLFSTKKNERLVDENKKLAAENEDYYNLIEKLKSEVRELRENYFKVVKQKEEIEDEKKVFVSKYNRLAKQFNDTNFQRQSKDNDLLTLSKKFSNLKKLHDDRIAEMDEKVIELNSAVRAKENETKALRNENSKLTVKNNTFQMKLTRYNSDLKYMESKLNEKMSETENYNKEVNMLRRDLESSRNVSQDLQLELQNEKLERIEAKKEVSKLRDSFSFETDRKYDDLKKVLNEQRSNEGELEKELEKTLKKNLQLSEKINRYENTLTQNEALRDENDDHKNEVEKLTLSMEKQSHDFQRMEGNLKAQIKISENNMNRASYLEREVKKLHKELKTKEKQLVRKSETNHELTRKDATLTIQLRNVREELHQIQNKTDDIKEDNARLRDLVQRLDSDREDLMKSEVKLRKEYNSLLDKLNTSRNNL